MPFALDFGDTCAVKELEMAHEELFADPTRDSIVTETMGYELSNTIKMLNFRTRCMCRDRTCQWWADGRCRCEGRIMCRHIGFEIRPRLSVPDEPSVGEMEMARAETTPTDLNRKPNEAFIVWKVRVANLVFKKADTIHNVLEEGAVVYRYESWRNETREERAIHFLRTVGDVRGLGHERGKDMTHVVGCFACGKIFVDETTLYAHVDARRFRGDRDHTDAQAVYTIELKPVRPTSSDYRPPEPRPTPTPEPVPTPRSVRNPEDRLDHVERLPSETRMEYLDRLRDQVQNLRQDVYDDQNEATDESYPEATGCSACGDIFFNHDDYYIHAGEVHGFSLRQAEENGIN